MSFDLADEQFCPISDVFHTVRPDLVLVDHDSKTVNTLELTVCNETNIKKLKQYKTDKYAEMYTYNYLTAEYWLFKVHSHTFETTTLGFVSDISQFCKINLKNRMSDMVRDKIITSVITDSFKINWFRNNQDVMMRYTEINISFHYIRTVYSGRLTVGPCQQ